MTLTKAQEKRIQDLIRQVHEHRLAESLAPVEEAIRSWREGNLPIFQIDNTIHQHTMRAKRYFAVYANTPARSADAIGILDEAKDLRLITEEEYKQLAGA